MYKNKKDQIIDRIVFALLLGLMSAITLVLFYRQCVGNMTGSGLYHADMKAYILEMQGLDSGYSFPYPLFFKLAAFIHLFVGPEWAVAIATMFLNSLAVVVVRRELFNGELLKIVQKLFPGREWIAGAALSVLSVSVFFVSMVFPPPGLYLPGIKYNYLGVFTGNPFHNATYMAARPFAVLAFLWFVKLLSAYEREIRYKDLVLFSLFLLAATMTKPSFTIIMVAAAGIVMLFRLIMSKGKNWKATVLLGLTFIPTFLDLLYQFNGVFVPKEGAEGGIGFCVGRIWGYYCDNILLALGLAMGFPIVVLLCNLKSGLCQNTRYCMSWILYLCGFVSAFFLYEKGFREPDFNFSWGYMYGIFFAFLGSLEVLLRATAEKKKPVVLALQWTAYLWHLSCGLYYFCSIFRGNMYY